MTDGRGSGPWASAEAAGEPGPGWRAGSAEAPKQLVSPRPLAARSGSAQLVK